VKVLVVGNDNRSTMKLVDYLNLLDGITVCSIAGDFREILSSGSIPETDFVILDTATVTEEMRNLLDELAAIAGIPRVLVLTIHPVNNPGTAAKVYPKFRFLSKDRGVDMLLHVIRIEESNYE
jgi:hypothetical protein